MREDLARRRSSTMTVPFPLTPSKLRFKGFVSASRCRWLFHVSVHKDGSLGARRYLCLHRRKTNPVGSTILRGTLKRHKRLAYVIVGRSTLFPGSLCLSSNSNAATTVGIGVRTHFNLRRASHFLFLYSAFSTAPVP